MSDIQELNRNKITSGKPTTISGYGITDAVNTTGNQTITGNKFFAGTTTVAAPVNATGAKPDNVSDCNDYFFSHSFTIYTSSGQTISEN